MNCIAVVEDEELIRVMIRFNLEKQGYTVECFADAPEFLSGFRPGKYDAVLLDIMLPSLSGRELVRHLRKSGDSVPVLMVTAVSEVASVVDSLELGADDYITKPFNMEELLARVRALIRRSQGERSLPSSRILRIGGHEVNLETREAQTRQGAVILTEKEAELLAYFTRNPKRALMRAEILEEVWGMDTDPTPRTVDNFVVKFRKLFEANPESPRHFLTVRASGYLFEP